MMHTYLDSVSPVLYWAGGWHRSAWSVGRNIFSFASCHAMLACFWSLRTVLLRVLLGRPLLHYLLNGNPSHCNFGYIHQMYRAVLNLRSFTMSCNPLMKYVRCPCRLCRSACSRMFEAVCLFVCLSVRSITQEWMIPRVFKLGVGNDLEIY